jgi:hypothetical protein
MLKPEDYRKRAHECFERAQKETGGVRRTLLEIAQNWLLLAKHVETEQTLMTSFAEAPLVPDPSDRHKN